MADIQQLIVDLRLRGDFNEKMGRAQKNLGGFNRAASATTGRMDKLRGKLRSPELKAGLLQGVGLSGGLIGFQLLTTGISKAVDIGSDAIRMAAEEEAAIAQLTRAIEANVDAWDGNIDAVEERINANQRLAFSDGEQREALRLLITQTNDTEEAFRVLGISMDFARTRGISLKTSADLLGRAYAGNFQTLSRYGVVLEKGATAQDALRKIQKLSEGQARAYAETTQGKLVRAQIALDDAMEDLGRTITPVVADLAAMAADTIPDLVIGTQEALAPLARLADEFDNIATIGEQVSDLVGRDLVNDFANFARIVGTGGAALGMDALDISTDQFLDTGERLPGILGDWQGSLQDVQRATIGVNQDTSDLEDTAIVLTGTWGRLSEASQDAAGSIDDVGTSATGVQETFAPLTSAIKSTAGSLAQTARAATVAAERMQEFKDSADQIAETRSLPRINAELKEQRKLLREAIEENNVKKFAAASAAIEQLRGEKALRKSGRRTLNEARENAEGQRKAQQSVTAKVNQTQRKIDKLGKTEAKPKVTLRDEAARARISRLRELLRSIPDETVVLTVEERRAISGAGGGGTGGGRVTTRRHTGGIVRAGDTAIIRQDEAVLRPASDTMIEPVGRMREGGTTVHVTPTLMIAATQVENQTTKTVRTRRFRENT